MAVTLLQQAALVTSKLESDVTFADRCQMAQIMIADKVLANPENYTLLEVNHAHAVFMSPWDFPYRAVAAVVSDTSISSTQVNNPDGASDQAILDRIEATWAYIR